MIKKGISIIGSVITWLLAITVVLLIFFMVKSRMTPNEIPSIMGYRLMAVLSGSMRPILEPGDMILTRSVDVSKLKPGDVITFITNQGSFVTHRVIYIEKRAGELLFKTKGDANNVEDEDLVSGNKLTGVMALRIPYGGYAANFIRKPFGMLSLVFFALAVILIGEIIKLSKKSKLSLQKAEEGK